MLEWFIVQQGQLEQPVVTTIQFRRQSLRLKDSPYRCKSSWWYICPTHDDLVTVWKPRSVGAWECRARMPQVSFDKKVEKLCLSYPCRRILQSPCRIHFPLMVMNGFSGTRVFLTLCMQRAHTWAKYKQIPGYYVAWTVPLLFSAISQKGIMHELWHRNASICSG